jgi:hypothetical protein
LTDPDWVLFIEPNMGPRSYSDAIPDIVAVKKSYARKDTRIYEVKASTADLRQDVKKQKWEKYLPFCDRLFFALGPNVNWQDTLGHYPVGVIVRQEAGWKVVRNAPPNLNKKPWSENVWLSLIFSHLPQLKRHQGDYDRLALEKEAILTGDLTKMRYKLSGELDAKLKDLFAREERVKSLEENARKEVVSDILKVITGTESKYWTPDKMKDILGQAFISPAFKVMEDNMKRLLEEALAKGLVEKDS